MVKLAGVSRAGFYRFDEHAEPVPERNVDLRDAIQRIALEWPKLWAAPHYRRIAPSWLDGESEAGVPLLREDNLLCVRKRKFVVTTDSNNGREIYPNLADGMALAVLLAPAAPQVHRSSLQIGGQFARGQVFTTRRFAAQRLPTPTCAQKTKCFLPQRGLNCSKKVLSPSQLRKLG
jgi:hypothetical protein